jgi:hypothetical protein
MSGKTSWHMSFMTKRCNEGYHDIIGKLGSKMDGQYLQRRKLYRRIVGTQERKIKQRNRCDLTGLASLLKTFIRFIRTKGVAPAGRNSRIEHNLLNRVGEGVEFGWINVWGFRQDRLWS